MNAPSKKRALVIGLSGGIGSGKSTVASMIRKLRIPVLCADLLAREAVLPGKAAYKKIIREFGKEILHPDRTLNRVALGAIVFSSAAKRGQLNAILHPEVLRAMKKGVQEHHRKAKHPIVLDIPLLFETGMDRLCDLTVVVYSPQSLMHQRLLKRDRLPSKAVRDRIRSQWPIAKKRKLADYVIDNSGTLRKTEEQVKDLFERLRSGER